MSYMPSDLVPIPTQPWDKRPSELPLDVDEVRTALWLDRGNITKAADRLKTSSQRLRSFIKNSAFLSAEMEEAKEQILDIAEGNVVEALTDDADPGRKDSMTRFVLAGLGRSRGYGNGAGGISVKPTGSGRMMIVWDDGTQINGTPEQPGDNAKVVNGK